jgi:hypothetical protein
MPVRRTPRRAVAALLLAVAALAAATGMAIASSGSAPRPSAWSLIRTFDGVEVYDITGVGARDAWLTGIGADNTVFVQRWNGARWRAVATPRGMITVAAAAVAASSASNAWVFTFLRPAVAASYAVAWHWTGRAWQSHRLPDGTSIDATAVFSRTDAWAFGMIGAGKPYVIRYDGRKWRQVQAPVQPTGASALSAHNIWIVGPTIASLKTFPFSYEAADWTGRSWRILKLPRVRVPKGMYLASPQILAAGAADIWIDFDEFSSSGQGPDTQTLLHYDAGDWRQIAVPRGSIFRASNLATDGHGGIWLALGMQQPFGSAMYDYRNGHWSKGVVLARPGRYTFINWIARVPGSVMAWAGGYNGHTTGNPNPHGVLYEYGR